MDAFLSTVEKHGETLFLLGFCLIVGVSYIISKLRGDA